MINCYIIIIGICILLIAVLNIIGVFTSSWTIPSVQITFGKLNGMNTIGIVPYNTKVVTEFPWFGVISILMYLTVALIILIVLNYVLISFEISQNGFDRGLRKWINIIAVLSILIFSFTFISLLLIGADLQTMNTLMSPVTFSLGYSGWLCIGSSVLLITILIPSLYVSYKRIEDHQILYL